MSGLARTSAVVALVAAAHVIPGDVGAQAFGVRLERGEVGVDGRGLIQVEGVSPGSVTSDYQQWLRLPISGFLVHPRVLRYTVAVRPLLGQHTASTLEQGTRSRNVGLDLSATLFQARRMTLSFQATRSSGASRGDFGTQNDFNNADFTTLLLFRDRYFPTTVTYSDRSVRDRWESAYTAEPIERDQRASRLRAEVRNKKLTTVLERTSYRDHRGTGDHDAASAQARHRLEWGKGSSMVSAVNLYRRTGSSEIQRNSWSERVFIAHTREVGTALSLSRQTWSRASQAGRNLSYDATTRYSPALTFEGALSASGQVFRSGVGGGLSRFRIAPSLRYSVNLPAGARLNTSGSVGSEKLSRTLPSDALLDVVEEAHEVDEARVFTLEQLRVERSSIEIWDEARTLLLQEDVDYRIVETGPVVDIHILPGSRVQLGEVVLVNYRYRSLAVEDSRLVYLNYETTLRLRGLSLRHGRRQRSEDTSGPSGALADPNDVDLWFGVSLSGRTRLGAVSLDATRRSRSASEIDYYSDELRGDLALPAYGTLESRVRASTTRTVAADLVTRTTAAGGTFSMAPSRSVRVSAGIDGWIWARDEQSPERFLSGHAMVTWRFGQVNTILTFDQVRRSNGLTRTENRWSVRVVRRF
jgi:hypothetical protein